MVHHVQWLPQSPLQVPQRCTVMSSYASIMAGRMAHIGNILVGWFYGLVWLICWLYIIPNIRSMWNDKYCMYTAVHSSSLSPSTSHLITAHIIHTSCSFLSILLHLHQSIVCHTHRPIAIHLLWYWCVSPSNVIIIYNAVEFIEFALHAPIIRQRFSALFDQMMHMITIE